MAVFEKDSRAWEKRGFSRFAVTVCDWSDLHEQYEVRDEKTGEVRRVAPDRLSPRGMKASPTGKVARTPVYERPELREQPKPPRRWSSVKYLAHVRSYPCCAPGCAASAPSEAHHFEPGSGMGRKCDDVFTAPLCTSCHTHWHAQGALPCLSREESIRVQLFAQRRCLADYVAGRTAA